MEEETDIREPDEQRLERLIPSQPLGNEETSFRIRGAPVSRRRRRNRQVPNNRLSNQLRSQRNFQSTILDSSQAASVADARIDYHYDPTPNATSDFAKALEESRKSMEEKLQVEEEELFLKDQMRLVEEEAAKERLQKEEERREHLEKRYGIVLSILRRCPYNSLDYTFYSLWKDWVKHPDEKLSLGNDVMEWLYKNRNYKLLKMLEEDEII